jgi:predicted alpha/beta hydrolase
VFKDHHSDIKFPIINFFAKDDYIVSENTVNLLMELFPNSDKKIVELNPKDHGCDNIKHSLMFRNHIVNFGLFLSWKWQFNEKIFFCYNFPCIYSSSSEYR